MKRRSFLKSGIWLLSTPAILPAKSIAQSFSAGKFAAMTTAPATGGGGGSTLNNNLVAYWKLDESSGSTRADSKGSNNLSDNNTVTSGIGKISNCAIFASASGNYLSVSDTTDLSMGAGARLTIAGWVMLDALSPSVGPFGKWTGDTGLREYQVFLNDVGGGQVRFQFKVRKADDTPGTSVQADTYGNVPISTWVFVVVYYDGTNIGISVNNGSFDLSPWTTDILDGNSPFTVGKSASDSTTFDGKVDELGVWKRALTSSEITELYNSGTGKTCCPF